ncbi:MAG TPA: helix-turn-helix domain-containing protein [Gemmatimonadales bacterium]|nr:helix-turn-helix domain-containing protein [Gemmatimonadales bacterium]
MRKTPAPPSPALAEALAGFGAGLRDLRRRRRLPMTYAADQARLSRATLYKIERGDPSVSFGLYAKVLQAYGLLGRLTVIVDGRFDAPGLAMERARLPSRIHLRAESP